MNRSNIRRAVLALFAAGMLVACGSDDDGDASTSGTEPTSTVAESTEGTGDTGEEGEVGEGEVIEVTAVDYDFEGLPDSVPAGTKLALANDAPEELHELVAIRLPDDEERSVEDLMALPPEELAPLMESGPPATVLLAVPGGDQIEAVGDGTLSEPGRYAIICAIPTGIAPQEYLDAVEEARGEQPEIEGAGPPHLVHGMYAELIVE